MSRMRGLDAMVPSPGILFVGLQTSTLRIQECRPLSNDYDVTNDG
jgi:hypothetical protein